jgi:CxxC motif-containing protein (DUF1111 family)
MKKVSNLTIVAWMAVAAWVLLPSVVGTQTGPTEAPAGFDDLTNGFVDQPTHDADAETFAEQETIADGLGPVYNAQSCGECHQNPVTGSSSQITEQRAGRLSNGIFVSHPGDSLIHSRATSATIQERILPGHTVRTFRTSLSVLGDGFVEAIANSTLQQIADDQPGRSFGNIRGQVIFVPLSEVDGATRIGRFGHKNQQASLLSFSGDAYLNEMGITTPMQPVENTSNGTFVGFGTAFDPLPEPEDDGEDLETFARFMRATKVPPREAGLINNTTVKSGEQLFDSIGCDICHTPRIVTAPAGTLINGGALRVHAALGNKVIRPFGDFLLHDIGTGDGIVQNGGNSTRNKVRTAPLWGVRTRNRLMHDGLSFTFLEAIGRHGGEAAFVTNRFNNLSQSQRDAIVAYLTSL